MQLEKKIRYHTVAIPLPLNYQLLSFTYTLHSFPDWLASTLREILPCSLWPNQLGPSFPVSSPFPEATDPTTGSPSRSSSSSDDSTLRTTATVNFTLQTPIINTSDPKDMSPTGVASLHSVCFWTLLFLTTLGTMGSF